MADRAVSMVEPSYRVLFLSLILTSTLFLRQRLKSGNHRTVMGSPYACTHPSGDRCVCIQSLYKGGRAQGAMTKPVLPRRICRLSFSKGRAPGGAKAAHRFQWTLRESKEHIHFPSNISNFTLKISN